MGRWQTRLTMLLTLGVIVSAIFALTQTGPFFVVLAYVFGFGVVWDVIYILLQQLRWDRDWPMVFQVVNGVVEGGLIYGLILLVGLPGIDRGSVPPGTFIAHYGLVWLTIFIWIQGPMRTLLPRWRFQGGRVV
jgi:hypothetical protein